MANRQGNLQALRSGFQTLVEQIEPVLCQVDGSIPSWLFNTSLYRTTPSMYSIPLEKSGKCLELQHWFDGIGGMHQFDIREDGSVWYNNKLTGTIARDTIANGLKPILFGSYDDPCVSIFGRVGALFRTLTSPPRDLSENNLNVTLTIFPNQLEPNSIAIKTDSNSMQIVDKNTFETKRFVTYTAWDERLNAMSSASHEEYDAVTNTYFNLNYDLMGKRTSIFSMDSTGQIKEALLDTPKGRPASYIHSFSSTSKYLVLTSWPCFVSVFKVLYYKSFSHGLTWQPEKQCLFYIVDRATMQHVATFESAQPFFCFHTINAFDEGDDIILDLIHYDDMKIIHQLSVANIFKGTALDQVSRFARFRLKNISRTGVLQAKLPKVDFPEMRDLGNIALELPTINERYRHHNYKFVYTVSSDVSKSMFFDSLVKLNVLTGESQKWVPGINMFPGEPIFVPHPQYENDEDVGVLLSVVLDGVQKRSYLYILDAKNMTVISRVAAPDVVPLGFHGLHVKH